MLYFGTCISSGFCDSCRYFEDLEWQEGTPWPQTSNICRFSTDFGSFWSHVGATLDPKCLPWDTKNEKKQEKNGPGKRLGTFPGIMLKKSRKVEGPDLPKPLKYIGFPMYVQCLAYSEKGS